MSVLEFIVAFFKVWFDLAVAVTERGYVDSKRFGRILNVLAKAYG